MLNKFKNNIIMVIYYFQWVLLPCAKCLDFDLNNLNN